MRFAYTDRLRVEWTDTVAKCSGRPTSFASRDVELGSDRIMFSADDPFEDMLEAAQWFDGARIDQADREKIGRTNALKLLKLTAE